jgi:hypothetical protein
MSNFNQANEMASELPKHDPTDYKAKWMAAQQGGAGPVGEPPTSGGC